MWKGIPVAIGVLALTAPSAALAVQPGHGKAARHGHHRAKLAKVRAQPNAGDVWTKSVGEPAGPGHSQDPHLPCADINLWGEKLADTSGDYTIDGFPPSGSMDHAYPTSSWTYDVGVGGPQIIAVIKVDQLIATAAANGDVPVNGQGYHFKLQFTQSPQKHKTFWVDCPAPSQNPGNGEGETPAPPQTPSLRPGAPAATASTPAASTEANVGAAAAESTAQQQKTKKPARRVRHRKISRRAVRPVGFTG